MENILVVPGPGNIPKDILEVYSKDVIHHRTDTFVKEYRKLNDNIQKVFKTENTVVTLSTSGTGGMEASVVNLFSPGDKVLVINIGNFGDRYIEICNAYSLNTFSLDYKWGTTYNLKEVEAFILKNADLKGVLVTHNETSTGVLNSIEPLAKLTKDTNILLVVDACTGLLVNEFEFDLWGVDCAISCSQKGFSLPTGLAFIALSKKAEKAMDYSKCPKYFFNLKTYIKSYEEHGYTPFSPNTSVIRAASYSVEKILEKGLDNIRAESNELRAHVVSRIEKIGFKVFSDDTTRSNSVLVIDLCGKTSMKQMKKDFEKNHNITLSLGKNEFADTAWRIGILPPMDKKKIDHVMDLVEKYIAK